MYMKCDNFCPFWSMSTCVTVKIKIRILPKSLKYNLPPSFMSDDDNVSSSFKDFPPSERK